MITSVKILPGCIACKTCESICPKIFQVQGTSQVVENDFTSHEKEILQAEMMCPVRVISVKKDGGETQNFASLLFEKALLKEKKTLTHDVTEYTFQSNGFSALPGQFVSLQMTDEQGSFARSYSLVKTDGETFTLCIKGVPNGRGTLFLQKLQTGDEIKISPATGHFLLQNTPAHKVFIATGTGIAPLMNMLKNTAEAVQKTVLFGVRAEEDIFYQKELESFPNTQVIIVLSGTTETWSGKKGFVTDYLNLVTPESEVYMCGNPIMISSVLAALEKQGHAKNLIFREEFAQTPIQTKKSFFERMILDGDIPNIFMLQNFLIFCGFLVPFIWYFFPSSHWSLWDVSWYSVTILMLIRPLSNIFPQWMIFKRLLPLRQGLGVLSSAIVVTNLAFSYGASPQNFVDAYFSLQGWTSWSSIVAHLAEISGFILLITSNNFSQRVLGAWWKRIQRLSYLYFFAGGLLHSIHAVSIPSMVIVAVLWGIAAWKQNNLSPQQC